MQFILTLAFLLSTGTVLASTCDDIFDQRDQGSAKAEEALRCFQNALNQPVDNSAKAHAYRQMSYLKFFIAEYFMETKMPTLLEAIALAENGLALFGEKYNVTNYMALKAEDRKTVAWLLYNYGLSTSRYVDIAGKFEAIRRMEDIKKSMNTIIRIKEETTSFYGAHRTLGIFHLKVPAIAGGQIALSGPYLEKAVNSTLHTGKVSQFPANNLALSDLYYKLNKTAEACEQTALVMALSESDVRGLMNGHVLETLENVSKARELHSSRRCP